MVRESHCEVKGHGFNLLRRSVSTVKQADTRSMFQDILNNFIIVRRRLSIFRMYFAYALHLMLIEFVVNWLMLN